MKFSLIILTGVLSQIFAAPTSDPALNIANIVFDGIQSIVDLSIEISNDVSNTVVTLVENDVQNISGIDIPLAGQAVTDAFGQGESRVNNEVGSIRYGMMGDWYHAFIDMGDVGAPFHSKLNQIHSNLYSSSSYYNILTFIFQTGQVQNVVSSLIAGVPGTTIGANLQAAFGVQLQQEAQNRAALQSDFLVGYNSLRADLAPVVSESTLLQIDEKLNYTLDYIEDKYAANASLRLENVDKIVAALATV